MGVVALRTEQGTTLIGGEQELRARLEQLAAEGRLVESGVLAAGRMTDGRYFAKVQLLDVAPRRRWRRAVVVALALAAAVVVAGIVWAVVVVVAWVLAHLVQIIAAVVVLVLLAIWLLSASGGKHCPGCNG